METNDILSSDLLKFVLVTLMSLVIGLSQRKLYLKEEDSKHAFGADRTFTLIGILGYILYEAGSGSIVPFLCGGVTLTLLFVAYYIHKIFVQKSYGITSIVIALITYCLAPVVCEKDPWMAILVVVAVLILTEMKDKFIQFTKSMNDEEFINLAKFMIIAGVVLPMLPKTELIEGSGLTPYSIWLATVVISGISYASYLVKKYVFKDGGVIITGILGGIYSSTATCIILGKKAKDKNGDLSEYVAAIFCSIAMMYFRILILLGIFNFELMLQYWYLFAIMIVTFALVALYFYTRKRRNQSVVQESQALEIEDEKNPLEFKVALLFAVLFVAFTIITHYALIYFGDSGLRVLSVIVGVTDINPFIINLFQTQHAVAGSLLILATFQAMISNSFVNMVYGVAFSGKKLLKDLALGASVICAVNILILVIFL